MNFESENSSEEKLTISQSLEALSMNNDETDNVQPVDSDKGKGFDELHETINQMANFMKTNNISSMLSRFKKLENYAKIISKEKDGIHHSFYFRFLAELEDYIREVWDKRKILAKKNREDLDTLKKKFQKISKILALDLAEYRENPHPDSSGDRKKSESRYCLCEDVSLFSLIEKCKTERGSNDVVKNINEEASTSKKSTSEESGYKKSTSEESKYAKLDSLEMREPMLPFHPDVETFGNRILKVGSSFLTYEEAFFNPEYRDLAFSSKKSTTVPIKFTQFVLKKLAVDAVTCPTFLAGLDPKAEEYLQKLIGPQKSTMRQVHPGNLHQRPSLFRNHFTKLFCRKVISNLQDADCDLEKFNKFARIFPFEVCKNVRTYEIDITNNFDDGFYDRMQHFLNDHFDYHVPIRETTALFLNNIRHFFETKFLPKNQFQYLKKFPRLNERGIIHFQRLYREYGNVRKQCYDCKGRVPHLHFEIEDLLAMPERNFDQLGSLLDTTVFNTESHKYHATFEKYLFFFVHALEVEERPTPVFFIDSMIYQCLKSLHRFRTLREDINMVDDIAIITLLCFLGNEMDFKCFLGDEMDFECFLDNEMDFKSVDSYSLDSTTLQNIKEYITTFVSKENNNVQFDVEYKAELLCVIPFRVSNTMCFDVCYASKKLNCQRGIMNFLRQLICSVLSSDYDPIKEIVCYNAFLGQESRFEIDQNIIESVRHFVLFSTKRNVAVIPQLPLPHHNTYMHLLKNCLK